MRSLFFTFLILLGLGAMAQKKHALIIAIGDYPDPEVNMWKPISSANDVPLVRGALEAQQFNDIAVLQDKQATKQGIVDALDKLIAKTGLGDVVVIHISSHGSQIEDDNGDEADGLDEAIVPYGATYTYDPEEFSKYAPGYLRDDEFGEKITRLRNKLGKDGDLLVVIDACHSGSATRDVDAANAPLVRGGFQPIVSSSFKNNNASRGNNTDFRETGATALSDAASPYVVISGAQASEKNYECWSDDRKPVGSLSYAFSKALASKDEKVSYRTLFSSIENIMLSKAPKQRPVLETDNSDRGIFSNRFISQKLYYTLDLRESSASEFLVNAGAVAGLTKGSVVKLYPVGTTDPSGKKELATGKITQVDNFKATLKLDKPNEALLEKGAWAFVTELAYGNDKVRLSVKDVNGSKRKVAEGLKDFRLVDFTGPYDLELSPSTDGKWHLKYTTSGDAFGEAVDFTTTDGIAKLKEALKTFDKIRYLRNMDITETGLKAQVDMLLVKDGEVDEALTKSRYVNGRLELRVGDQLRLRVINTGDKAFYVNVVDIQPDGIVNPILPNKKLKDRNKRPAPVTAADCRVEKGDTLNILNTMAITIGPPLGNEVFKVFLSSDMLDLEEILVTARAEELKGTQGRGTFTKLESLFKGAEVNDKGTRGGDVTVETEQTGTTFSKPFTIVAK